MGDRFGVIFIPFVPLFSKFSTKVRHKKKTLKVFLIPEKKSTNSETLCTPADLSLASLLASQWSLSCHRTVSIIPTAHSGLMPRQEFSFLGRNSRDKRQELKRDLPSQKSRPVSLLDSEGIGL